MPRDQLCNAITTPLCSSIWSLLRSSGSRLAVAATLAPIIAPMLVGALSFVSSTVAESGANAFYSAVIDPASGFAYFGSYTFPGRVCKFRVSDTTTNTTTLFSG